MQTYIHHVIALVGGFGSFYCGHYTIMISVRNFICMSSKLILFLQSISLLTEISTPFVNYRQMMYVQKLQDSKLFVYNNLLFVAFFFIFRICFYPITIYRIYCGQKLYYTDVKDLGLFIQAFANETNIVKILSLVLGLFYVLMYILQVYWFKKILAVANRSFSRSTKMPNQKQE